MEHMQESIIDLDTCVLNALDLFVREGTGTLDPIPFQKPIVIGSGNAAVTGKILFEYANAVFADESDYMEKIKATGGIDGAILISASGGKHAPGIAQFLQGKQIKTVLLTNTKHAPASSYVWKTHVFQKNPEPYTYNTSTYLSIILAHTKEDPHEIVQYIDRIKTLIPEDLSRYRHFYFLIPGHLEFARDMFTTKFDELFGPQITVRVYTLEQTKHAKTIVGSDSELFVSFGVTNTLFGLSRMEIPLPEDVGYGTLLLVGYYLIGQIQKVNEPYFKENITAYLKQASDIFHESLPLIVA